MEKMTAEEVIKQACRNKHIAEWWGDLSRLSSEEFEKLREEIKKLKHHKDTTIGLWATDTDPAILFNSDEKEMFQITY